MFDPYTLEVLAKQRLQEDMLRAQAYRMAHWASEDAASQKPGRKSLGQRLESVRNSLSNLAGRRRHNTNGTASGMVAGDCGAQ